MLSGCLWFSYDHDRTAHAAAVVGVAYAVGVVVWVVLIVFLCAVVAVVSVVVGVVVEQEAVELPLSHPELYEDIGIKPPKGVILYGVPGTGELVVHPLPV